MARNDSTDKAERAKRAALKLLAAGIIRPSEAARLLDVSPQLMNHWAGGIDCKNARAQYLTRIWRRHAR